VGQQHLYQNGVRPQVDVKDRVPRVLGVGAYRFHTHAAGGVDEPVDSLERRCSRLGCRVDGRPIGHVDDGGRHPQGIRNVLDGR
jgi:hypothetical protein